MRILLVLSLALVPACNGNIGDLFSLFPASAFAPDEGEGDGNGTPPGTFQPEEVAFLQAAQGVTGNIRNIATANVAGKTLAFLSAGVDGVHLVDASVPEDMNATSYITTIDDDVLDDAAAEIAGGRVDALAVVDNTYLVCVAVGSGSANAVTLFHIPTLVDLAVDEAADLSGAFVPGTGAIAVDGTPEGNAGGASGASGLFAIATGGAELGLGSITSGVPGTWAALPPVTSTAPQVDRFLKVVFNFPVAYATVAVGDEVRLATLAVTVAPTPGIGVVGELDPLTGAFAALDSNNGSEPGTFVADLALDGANNLYVSGLDDIRTYSLAAPQDPLEGTPIFRPGAGISIGGIAATTGLVAVGDGATLRATALVGRHQHPHPRAVEHRPPLLRSRVRVERLRTIHPRVRERPRIAHHPVQRHPLEPTMRRTSLRLLLLLGFAAPAFGQGKQPEPIAYLNKGIELHTAGQYEEAIGYIARYRSLVPRDWRGHAWQALTLLKQATTEKNPTRRAALVDEARSMQAPLIKQAGMPFRSPLRHYLLGMAANVSNDRIAAYKSLQKVVESDPALFEPYEAIRLRYHANLAFALASMDVATVHIMQGAYEDANKNMEDAKRYLPADDPRRRYVEVNLAVVKEGMGQYDVAIEHMRNCIEYARKDKDEEKLVEYTATVALIHLHSKDVESARKVLEELPEGTSHPDVTAARCRIRMIETERDPEMLLDTLKYFREAMKGYPEDQVQRLAVDYGNLCITYISRADAEANRAVLEKAVEIVDATRLRHPECPPAYWLLSKLYSLLGNEKKAEEFKLLHTRKKEEYKSKHQYDKRGRTRCAQTT